MSGMKESVEDTIKGILITFGAQPSDIIRNYARELNIDIIWVTEIQELNEQGLKNLELLVDDLIRRINNE